MKYVEKVYKDKLCSSCGICKGVCPVDAIYYKYDKAGFFRPYINKDKCIECGKCSNVCPGNKYYITSNSASFKLNNCFYGHSRNRDIRKNSASGGLTTELLCGLVNDNIVDYCIMVKNITDINNPEVLITNNIKEIVENKTSKYCPVPIGDIILRIKESNSRYAIVGLPCQVSALRKIFNNRNERLIFISLFCNHLPSANATLCIANTNGIYNIKKILYRGEGWPGFIRIFSNDKNIKLPYRKTFAKYCGEYFWNFRCRICNDPFGENADISMGDAYFLKDNGEGNTFCVIRNKVVLAEMDSLTKKGKIELNSFNNKLTFRKFFAPLLWRTSIVNINLRIAKKLNCKLPDNYEKVLINNKQKIRMREYVLFLKKEFLNKIISKNKFLWRFVFNKKGR